LQLAFKDVSGQIPALLQPQSHGWYTMHPSFFYSSCSKEGCMNQNINIQSFQQMTSHRL